MAFADSTLQPTEQTSNQDFWMVLSLGLIKQSDQERMGSAVVLLLKDDLSRRETGLPTVRRATEK